MTTYGRGRLPTDVQDALVSDVARSVVPAIEKVASKHGVSPKRVVWSGLRMVGRKGGQRAGRRRRRSKSTA